VAATISGAGISGLHDELRPGRPRTISDERVARLVHKTLQSKPQNATHWSIRQIAEHTRISKSTVHCIWQAFGLAEAFPAFQRSICSRKSTGYCRFVFASTGKCSGFVRR